MKRRNVLFSFGACLSIAGCLSNEPTGNGPGTATPANGNTDFSIGTTTDEVHAHRLTVLNSDDSSRLVELHIRDVASDEIRLDRLITLEKGGEISGELRQPAEYEVRITLPNAEVEHVTTVDYFDTCNEYETMVAINPGGMLTSETLTTDLACPHD